MNVIVLAQEYAAWHRVRLDAHVLTQYGNTGVFKMVKCLNILSSLKEF